MVYCIDTSALLDGWNRYYPPDILPSLWTNLEEMIASGELISPDEVLTELSQKDDAVHAWAKTNGSLFVPLDEDVQKATAEVLAQFPRLVGAMKDRSHGDAFVIGLARVRTATVVSGEKARGVVNRPRIPMVCEHFGIRHLSLLELIREKGWRFS